MADANKPTVPEISVDEVKKSLDTKDDVILLDVRTIEEYSRGKIPGGINLPVDEIEGNIQKVIPDKSAKVYVYCLSGHRSLYAAEAMMQAGYANVYNVTSGMLGWRAKNFPEAKE
jgi:phage shock protein E